MTTALLEADLRHVWHPFTQATTASAPIAIASASGATLTTADGKEILDLISSWWVTLHGHAHPAIAKAIADQAMRLEQVIFAEFTHPPAIELAARLAEILPGGLSRVFYSDNGSTSVEVALKLCYQYWQNLGTPRRCFLAFEGGYHGDTVGAMSAGAKSGFYAPFEDLLFAVEHIPFPETWEGDPEVETKEAASLSALDLWLELHGRDTAAMILEPLVQGASGMRMCRPQFVALLVQRLRAAGVLVIFDEVMTGFGRTGTLFAAMKIGQYPDVICLSKGLTGGFLPLSATICRQEIYEAFLGESFDRAFAHGHSFTANPLGCAAALASLDLLLQPETTARIASIETQHRGFIETIRHNPAVVRARVTGTIAAIELASANDAYDGAIGRRLKQHFLDQGLLIRPLGRVLYLLPPYCISPQELNRAYDALTEAVERFAEE